MNDNDRMLGCWISRDNLSLQLNPKIFNAEGKDRGQGRYRSQMSDVRGEGRDRGRKSGDEGAQDAVREIRNDKNFRQDYRIELIFKKRN